MRIRLHPGRHSWTRPFHVVKIRFYSLRWRLTVRNSASAQELANEMYMVRVMCAIAIVVFAAIARADVVLYDASLHTLPSSQGWYYLTDPLTGALAAQSNSGGVLTLDTTPRRSDSAGYFSFGHPQVGTLDRINGFSIRLDARILSEIHVSNHRAGFNLIVETSDGYGLELGFWANRIWAQNDSPLFTQAESVAISTTAAMTRYDLDILGGSYTLHANGSPILTGALRDYSAFGLPYTIPSFLFVGDNTSSAQAAAQISRIELNSLPEISSMSILGVAAALLGSMIRRRQQLP